jgi:hypothetical protein
MSESGEATQATETPAATEANGKGHRNGHGVAPRCRAHGRGH